MSYALAKQVDPASAIRNGDQVRILSTDQSGIVVSRFTQYGETWVNVRVEHQLVCVSQNDLALVVSCWELTRAMQSKGA